MFCLRMWKRKKDGVPSESRDEVDEEDKQEQQVELEEEQKKKE